MSHRLYHHDMADVAYHKLISQALLQLLPHKHRKEEQGEEARVTNDQRGDKDSESVETRCVAVIQQESPQKRKVARGTQETSVLRSSSRWLGQTNT